MTELTTEDTFDTRQIWALAVAMSIIQIGFYMVIPIFPFYVDQLGASGVDLGLITAAFPLTQMIFAGPRCRQISRPSRSGTGRSQRRVARG